MEHEHKWGLDLAPFYTCECGAVGERAFDPKYYQLGKNDGTIRCLGPTRMDEYLEAISRYWKLPKHKGRHTFPEPIEVDTTPEVDQVLSNKRKPT